MRFFIKLKGLVKKILISDVSLYIYSLFYKRESINYSIDIVKKKTISSTKAWDSFSQNVQFIIKNIHPKFYLATSVARKAFSPIDVNLSSNKKYILKDINLYSFYSIFLSRAYGFLDYHTAFNWLANWGSIFNKALGESSLDQKKPSYIIEFGSGLGVFPILLSSYFPKTRLFLYDLPVMISLQKINHNYLSNLGCPINKSKFQYFDALNDLKNNISLLKSDENIFFIAYWSFSEAPLNLREEFLPIFKSCSKIIIVSNSRIFGIDNNKYFEELSTKLVKSHKYFKLKLPLEKEGSSKKDIFSKHSIHLFTRK